MTIPIVISSPGHDPSRVAHVHTVYRNEHGQFVRGEAQPHVLTAGQCVELYIHSGVQLEIHEHAVEPVVTEGAAS